MAKCLGRTELRPWRRFQGRPHHGSFGWPFDKLVVQPSESSSLVVFFGTAELGEQPQPAGRLWSYVLCSLIAVTAQGLEVLQCIAPSVALGCGVTDVQSRGTSCSVIGIAGGRSAHLTGIAVSAENLCSQLRRDVAGEAHRRHFRWVLYEPILSGTKISCVMMRLDRPSFFIPKFAQSARILDLVPAGVAHLFRRHNLSDVSKEKCADSSFACQVLRHRANGWVAEIRRSRKRVTNLSVVVRAAPDQVASTRRQMG